MLAAGLLITPLAVFNNGGASLMVALVQPAFSILQKSTAFKLKLHPRHKPCDGGESVYKTTDPRYRLYGRGRNGSLGYFSAKILSDDTVVRKHAHFIFSQKIPTASKPFAKINVISWINIIKNLKKKV